MTIYYIDRRTPGRNEDVLLTRCRRSRACRLVKGKVGTVERPATGLLLQGRGRRVRQAARGRGRPGGAGHRHGPQHVDDDLPCSP